jgi:hypothetical protein
MNTEFSPKMKNLLDDQQDGVFESPFSGHSRIDVPFNLTLLCPSIDPSLIFHKSDVRFSSKSIFMATTVMPWEVKFVCLNVGMF